MVNGKPVPPKDTRSEFEQVQPPPGDLTNRARAKTTGEPSLVLAVSAIGAAREAVRLLKESLLEEKVAFVPLSTPLTPLTLLNAVWGTKSIADMPSLGGGKACETERGGKACETERMTIEEEPATEESPKRKLTRRS
jgi:hypothetical protein